LTAPARPRDCAVFLTHLWTPAIAAHYARLKREAGEVLDVFLAFQPTSPDGLAPGGLTPDLVVGLAQGAALLPTRHAEVSGADREVPWGYVDLVWCTAFLDPKLAQYDRFWLVEYDVDFSGNWRDFFAETSNYAADLLATRIRRRSDDPRYGHLKHFAMPQDAVGNPVIALFCISRLSRRLVESYRQELARRDWRGHFEIVLPSVAAALGLSIEEIGGEGPFTPPERRNRFYRGPFDLMSTYETTFNYRPVQSFRYFGEAPGNFRDANHLHHPVKTDQSLWQRVRLLRERQKHRWRTFKRRLH